MSSYRMLHFLLLLSGVFLTDGVTIATGFDLTTSDSLSAFIISIKINNRIYNESLEDRQSPDYKALRQEVEDVFFNTFSLSPSAQYQEITDMMFSNGSVVARSTVLFGEKEANPQALKNLFITNYQQHPSMMLDLNLNYTAASELVPVSFLYDNIPESFHSNEIILHTAVPTSSSIPPTGTTPPDTPGHTPGGGTPATTGTSTESRDPPTTPLSTSAGVGTSTSLQTESQETSETSPSIVSGDGETTTDDSVSHQLTPAAAEPGTEPGTEPGKEPGKEPGTEPGTEPGREPGTEPGKELGVPTWGIVILILAAIILFFLLFLIILLLLCWCCWGRQRGFMNVSDPEPISYYNPDIPMYSTHITFDSHNGKSADSAHKHTSGTSNMKK